MYPSMIYIFKVVLPTNEVLFNYIFGKFVQNSISRHSNDLLPRSCSHGRLISETRLRDWSVEWGSAAIVDSYQFRLTRLPWTSN